MLNIVLFTFEEPYIYMFTKYLNLITYLKIDNNKRYC